MYDKLKDAFEENFACGCLICLLALVLIVGVFFLEAWVVMLLWNAIVPAIFALPTIGFWMACGMKLLISFLFGVGKTISSKNS
jgi:hypothetical protein